MGGRLFLHMRKKAGSPVDSTVTRFSASIPEGGITPNWLLERLGFDPEQYWRDIDSPSYLDTRVAVETVALAHADRDFQALLPAWDDDYDGDFEGKSFTGRLAASALNPAKVDWPLARSWFHEMYMDLARLDGAMGLDLSTPDQLNHAVSCYWKQISCRSRTQAASRKLDADTVSIKQGI